MSGHYEHAIIRGVADTHALIWYLYRDPRLSRTAYDFIESVDTTGDLIAVSSITLVEVVYLTEKRRIPEGTFAGILTEFGRPDPCFVEVSVDRRIAQALHIIAREAVPDMPDRIIAATAVALEVPVVSRGGKIKLSSVQTIW